MDSCPLVKKRLSVNKYNYKGQERHRILGSDVEMRAGYSPAWKVREGFPEEVTSKMTSEPSTEGREGFGQAQDRGHLACHPSPRAPTLWHLEPVIII